MRNFLQYPFAPYKGQLTSRAVRANGVQRSMVGSTIVWPLYTANGATLGNNNPNYVVNFELQGVGPNIVSQQWIIQSVYIDNENVGFPVYVFFPDTFFAVSCPPNSSGWYQVFTNGRSPRVCALGITDADIAASATTGVFFTDALMVPYLDQEIASSVDLRRASPTIALSGSGGELQSITIVNGGSRYPVGTGIAISGGGGTGATATCTLDQFGRITGVTIGNRGAGYTGPPVVAPNNANVAASVWNSTRSWNDDDICQYNGYLYECTTAIPAITSDGAHPIPPNDPTRWFYSGLQNQATAALSAEVSSITGGSTITSSSLYGASALGDQSINYVNDIGSAAVFRNNLFGTPYGSGFIYLTNAFIAQLSPAVGADVCNWQFENTDNEVLWAFQSMDAPVTGALLNLQGANIKLDASKTWRLRSTQSAGGAILISHNFTWTYNQG